MLCFTGQETCGFIPRTNRKPNTCVPTTSNEPNVLAGRCLFYISQNPISSWLRSAPNRRPFNRNRDNWPQFFQNIQDRSKRSCVVQFCSPFRCSPSSFLYVVLRRNWSKSLTYHMCYNKDHIIWSHEIWANFFLFGYLSKIKGNKVDCGNRIETKYPLYFVQALILLTTSILFTIETNKQVPLETINWTQFQPLQVQFDVF